MFYLWIILNTKYIMNYSYSILDKSILNLTLNDDFLKYNNYQLTYIICVSNDIKIIYKAFNILINNGINDTDISMIYLISNNDNIKSQAYTYSTTYKKNHLNK